MRSVDIIVKSFERDLVRLNFMLNSAKKYLQGFKNFFVILEDDEVCKNFAKRFDNDFFQFYFAPPTSINGYIYQQFIKFDGLNLSGADYILPLDSDMVFFRNADCNDWFLNDKPFIIYSEWQSPDLFPPISLASTVLLHLGRKTHDLRIISNEIEANHTHYGIEVLISDQSILKFIFNDKVYEINKNRLHDTWMWSIKDIVGKPVDTMQIHYIFERKCLDYVKNFLETYVGESLENGINNTIFFPVFSEYEVYGNLIYNSKELSDTYVFIETEKCYHSSGQLPIIKCNSREDSALFIYEKVLNGDYSTFSNRNELLAVIRNERREFHLEDWN